jgi:hypothetical protein
LGALGPVRCSEWVQWERCGWWREERVARVAGLAWIMAAWALAAVL